MVMEREAIRVCGRGFCISWRRSDQFTAGGWSVSLAEVGAGVGVEGVATVGVWCYCRGYL
jgi:hypothetical protein